MKNYLIFLSVLIALNLGKIYAQPQWNSNITKFGETDTDNTEWFRKGPFCADVQSLAMAPSNPDVLYLGTYATGIYKTTDGGENWIYCSTENLPVYEDTILDSRLSPSWKYGDYYPINAIAVDPQDESHLWAGAFERGLYESKDGGESWQKANETLPDTLTVRYINVNPIDPSDILLGTGDSFLENGGVYRTIDDGDNWVLIDSLPHGGSCNITDIARDPTDNDHIMIGISNSNEPDFYWGIKESYDNGDTWQELMGDFRVQNICIDPQNPEKIWGIVLTGFGDWFLMFSSDGGQNWEFYEGFEYPYYWVASMYADADFNLYIERQISDGSVLNYSILKSEDKGDTWFEVENLSNIRPNPKHTISLTSRCQASSTNTDNVLFGTYYGVFHSEDGGLTTQLQNEGLTNSYIPELEVHPFNSDIVYAAGKQGMWKSTDACRSWEKVLYESVGIVKFNLLHPDTLYCLGAEPMRSYDGGVTFENIRHDIPWGMEDFAIHPMFTNIVFLSSGSSLYRSIDYGDHWTMVFDSPQNEWESIILIDPSTPNTIYFGENRSLDMGLTWEYSILDKRIIAVHPQNPDLLFGLSSDGYDVYVSNDRGLSFQLLDYFSEGNVNNKIRNFTISKDDPDYMFFCTTNDGVHYSTDAGVNWQQLEGNYEKRSTDVIPLVDEDKYYVATYGDGVWVYDPTYVSVSDLSAPPKENNLLSVAPNPFNEQATIFFTNNIAAHVNVSVYNMQGKRITTLLDEYKMKGEHKITWNGKNQNGKEVIPGIYMVHVQSGKNTNSCKIVLIK